MTREERALALVLFKLNPDTQPWNGDAYAFSEALRRGEYRAELAVKQARSVIQSGWTRPDEERA